MKLSHTSEMAIHGLWELANQDGNERMLVAEIARRQSVSESYLAKIFHRLGKAGLVVSRRGKVGGFVLARPAEMISVGDVVRLFERDFTVGGKGRPKNGRQAVLAEVMKDAREKIFDVLDNVSLADLKQESPEADSPKLNRRKYTRKVGRA
jgi:Rrf2 family protein